MRRFVLGIAVLFCVMVLTAGLFLKKGIRLEGGSIGPVHFTTVTLVWKKKLELDIQSLLLAIPEKRQEQKLFDLDLLDRIVPTVLWIERIFSRIEVQELRVAEGKGGFQYEAGGYHLNMTSPLGTFRTDVNLVEHSLVAFFEVLTSENYSTRASGQMHFDTKSRVGRGRLNINFADSLPIALDLDFDMDQLSFSGKESEIITGIKPFVDLFGLSPSIQKWITDYLSGDRYTLKSFSGSFPWNDPLVLVDTFLAEVRVDGCEYTFAPGLEPIKTDFTDVLFQKGVLIITPNRGSFYGQDTEDSWLDIDFNDPDNILLIARIVTHARVNRDIVNLVEYYDIPLPFLQTDGTTAADLTITVNLNKELVTAKGVFEIVKGAFSYNGQEFAVENTRIVLDDSRVDIETLRLRLADILMADIQGSFDAAAGTGEYDIDIQECRVMLGNKELTLDDSAPRPHLHYSVTAQSALVTAGASAWKAGGLSLTLGSFSTPFSLKTLSGEISRTTFAAPPYFDTEISGTFSLQKQTLDLQASLLHCKVKGLELARAVSGLKIGFDRELTIRSTEESMWRLNTVPVTLFPSEFSFSDTLFSVRNGKIQYGTMFESAISGHFNHLSRTGEFLLEDLDIQEESIGHFLSPDDGLTIKVDERDEGLLLEIDALGMSITAGEDNSWVLLFKDLATVCNHSPLLQRYKLNTGRFELVSKGGGAYTFSAELVYPYALLVEDGKPVDLYRIHGSYEEKDGLRAVVNDGVTISYKDVLKIRSQDISFNAPAIIKFSEYLSGLSEKDSGASLQLSGSIEAQNASIVLSPERQLPADTIHLQFSGKKTSIQLDHHQGKITFDIDEDTGFVLAGSGLDDDFMNGMFPGATFSSGTLSLAAKGEFDDFTAMFQVENTILRDFKGLNNILALVNTIPALVTFSLPSYSTKGLPVDRITAGFEVKEGVARFSSLSLESPEISMAGKGWIDFPVKKIDMDLNMITRAKQNVNKIPLVGYILVGKEKRPSITVKVTGDLYDPKVQYSAFKEVVTEPFYMLYRTLALPAYLVAPMIEKGKSLGEDVYWKSEDEMAQ